MKIFTGLSMIRRANPKPFFMLRNNICRPFAILSQEPRTFFIRQTTTKLTNLMDKDSVDEILDNEVYPMSRQQEGFLGMTRLFNELNHTYVIQTKWRTMDDLKNTTVGTHYYDLASKKLDEYIAEPVVVYYDGQKLGPNSLEDEESIWDDAD
mmetsp:Transcript_38053/g.48534  ORF Transcript_38053/g.48534 Transcript_38053/m.48534 type:complete len:152 (+) Transcript_38053:60-515(+)